MPPSPDLYRNIFEAASDGLIISDLETGLVVEANPAAGAMLGYARQEFIGLHPTAFIHPDSLHRFSQAAQAASIRLSRSARCMARSCVQEACQRGGQPRGLEGGAVEFT